MHTLAGVSFAQFSESGKYILTNSFDNTIRLWGIAQRSRYLFSLVFILFFSLGRVLRTYAGDSILSLSLALSIFPSN